MKVFLSAIFVLIVLSAAMFVLVEPSTMLFRPIGLLDIAFVMLLAIMGWTGFRAIAG